MGYNAFLVDSSFVLGKIIIIYSDLLLFINSERKKYSICFAARMQIQIWEHM